MVSLHFVPFEKEMIEFIVVCSATCEKERGGDVVGYCGDGTNAAAITDAPREEAMHSV